VHVICLCRQVIPDLCDIDIVCACVCVFVRECVCVRMFVNTLIHQSARLCVCVYVCVHISKHNIGYSHLQTLQSSYA